MIDKTYKEAINVDNYNIKDFPDKVNVNEDMREGIFELDRLSTIGVSNEVAFEVAQYLSVYLRWYAEVVFGVAPRRMDGEEVPDAQDLQARTDLERVYKHSRKKLIQALE